MPLKCFKHVIDAATSQKVSNSSFLNKKKIWHQILWKKCMQWYIYSAITCEPNLLTLEWITFVNILYMWPLRCDSLWLYKKNKKIKTLPSTGSCLSQLVNLHYMTDLPCVHYFPVWNQKHNPATIHLFSFISWFLLHFDKLCMSHLFPLNLNCFLAARDHKLATLNGWYLQWSRLPSSIKLNMYRYIRMFLPRGDYDVHFFLPLQIWWSKTTKAQPSCPFLHPIRQSSSKIIFMS